MQEIVARETGAKPTVIQGSSDFVICYEFEQLPLPNLAVTLTEGRRDFLDCASRVHTRKDVEWHNSGV